MSIHQRIREVIAIKDFSDIIIAEKTNMTDATIRNIKKGKSDPNFKFLYWLFSEFPNLNINWLFYGREPQFLDLDKEEKNNLVDRIQNLEEFKSESEKRSLQIKEILNQILIVLDDSKLIKESLKEIIKKELTD